MFRTNKRLAVMVMVYCVTLIATITSTNIGSFDRENLGSRQSMVEEVKTKR